MPRWSVIMPVLNGEKYLPSALRSVLRTLPQDAELRIMDDGSSDATPQLLAHAAGADRRVVLHRHERPQGVANSLNELAAAGDSALLGRVDADDLCLPGRWSTGERLLRRADYAFTPSVFIDANGRPTGADQPGHLSPEAMPLHLMLGCCLVHPTAMMRREAFDVAGGYGATHAEDYELWLRSLTRGIRLSRSTVPGLLYRRHTGQVTVRKPWMNEGTESPLWRSYAAAAEQTLGSRPEGLYDFFSAALHRDPLPPESLEGIEGVIDELARAAHRLGKIDRALFEWRLRRQSERLRQRAGVTL